MDLCLARDGVPFWSPNPPLTLPDFGLQNRRGCGQWTDALWSKETTLSPLAINKSHSFGAVGCGETFGPAEPSPRFRTFDIFALL